MGCARHIICLSIVTAFACTLLPAQRKTYVVDSPYAWQLEINPRIITHHDSTWIYSGFCKILQSRVEISKPLLPGKSSKPDFLTVHGNFQYDFLYRTLVDTPFYQRDFSQHSIRTNFNLIFRNTLPVQVTLLHRNSNSPYFRDITDVTVRFRQQDYFKQLKEGLMQQSIGLINVTYQGNIHSIDRKYQSLLTEIKALEQWLASPARLQEMVAEKERMLKQGPVNGINQLPLANPALPIELPADEIIKKAISDKINHRITAAGDSILNLVKAWTEEKNKRKTDSVLNTQTASHIENKKQELALAKKKLADLEKQSKGLKKTVADSLQVVKQEISRLGDATAVKQYIRKKGLPSGKLPRGWQFISSIESIGIGRTWVDYTELTVKNISLNGINIEANPGNIYLAVAAGRINYRFRDFVVAQTNQPKQSLYLLRAGLGKKEGNNFILTWYDGKRNLLNSFTGTPPVTSIKPERVLGMSAETRLQVNDNQFIIAEFAKSSFHNTGTANASSAELFEKVKNFKDHSNEAYSIKLNSYWPQSGTKITGYYKKMGEHFQSFNLQPVNSIQEAFQVKLQQHLWKKKLTIDASIRKNDYSNPLITQSINSQTVFKSLQLSLRIPKYPFLTIGFAPSSQLTIVGNQRLVENQYNTLNAVASYAYRVKQLAMVSNATFLKFYNSAPDTGFIYYNASSFTLTQFLYTGHWQLQTGLTISRQKDLHVLSVEQSATYQVKEWLSLTAGLTVNRVNKSLTQCGANAGLNMNINKFGNIQVGYEKYYLPGTDRNLLPVELGRVGYTRFF